MEMYLFQVACAALGMTLGYLAVTNFQLRKRCKAAEERLKNLETWASGASPLIMGLIAVTGLTSVDIQQAREETKH